MSVTIPERDIPAPEADATPAQRGRPRRLFRFALLLAVMMAGLGLLGLLAPGPEPGAPLDPEGVGAVGGGALKEVLVRQGIEVEVVRSIQDFERTQIGPDTSVLLADPNSLSPAAELRFVRAADQADTVIIVGPARQVALRYGVDVGVNQFPLGSVLGVCSGPLVRPGDAVTQADYWYSTKDESMGCFPAPTLDQGATRRSALVTIAPTDRHPGLTLVGVAGSWRNTAIDKEANAAVALRTLGQTPRLIWYQPGASDATATGPDGDDGSAAPPWLTPLVVLALVAIVALAVARGRRFGALVGEDLPQVVPAAEVTLARGRLYAKSRDTQRVAAVLRRGTIDRVSRRLSVSNEADLASALAASTGRHPEDVADALFGPTPTDDEQLRTLAQRLTDLEKGIDHS